MLREVNRRVRAGESFAFETTLAGRNYARLILRWRAAGYHVKLIFLRLPTADLAVCRVSARVAQCGHGVSEDVIRRRFDAGRRNLKNLYQKLGDVWVVYDNSGPTPLSVATGGNR